MKWLKWFKRPQRISLAECADILKEQGFSPEEFIEGLQKEAISGTLILYGRKTIDKPLTKIPKEYWQDHKIEINSFRA